MTTPKFLALTFTGVLTLTSSPAQAQECNFCIQCGQDDKFRAVCATCVSNIRVESEPTLCGGAEECAELGEICDEGTLSAARDLWESIRQGQPASIVEFVRQNSSRVRYVESKQLLLVSTQCSRGRPVFALPVPGSARVELARFLRTRSA